ncbi:Pet127 family protein [Aspergillus homomorphus CBS 101889]|uniref:Pet127-domain-containing protein n=1 Tax=Aspergillus homomorphus (strain CBS 101889) TaxID=1450537 RepID=A0A395HIM7_ASPHC|nr:Pet127-domain-containing protein [Aspergillus homomorphus CBS 101889]RAL07772.1 Pet127-domain-containing protein [Aspergillus homomorphus CBS 101889]
MLRASWRSAVTPARSNLYWSCLSRGSSAPPRQQLWTRSFYSQSRLRSQTPTTTDAEHPLNPPVPNKLDIGLHSEPEPEPEPEPESHHEADNVHDKASKIEVSADETSDAPAQTTSGSSTQEASDSPARKDKGSSPVKHARAISSSSGTIKLRKFLKPLPVETPEVPSLSFGLDRVLFNQGVYTLRDPRSRVYNFDPYLGSIMPVTEFDFQALKDYITSSKDKQLHSLARKARKKYIGSSSSMTSVLSHFHYLLSAWRPVDISSLSQGFSEDLRTFTRLLRAPAAMFLHYQDGVYAIDADKEFDSANILMNLGKSMEKLLTLPKEEFERYRRSSANKITPEEENAIPESYHYSTMGDFLMRSQLDAYDPRLPGTGMFDLKTRAVVSIRMDARNFEHGLGYEIRRPRGMYESYEREYYDMIRAAFLKYSLQVRVGRMDGIFVAFHNIERIFGFQYISLNEMDKALHGQFDNTLGDREFELSIQLWNEILNRATKMFPKQSIRFHFETRPGSKPYMNIFAEPVTDDEITAIQNKNKEAIDAYQKRILDLPDEPAPVLDKDVGENGDLVPEDEDAMYDETLRDPAEASAEEEEDDAAMEDSSTNDKSTIDTNKKLFAAVLTIDNFVNDVQVERPEKLTKKDRWEIAYRIDYLDGTDPHTHHIYASLQKRRRLALDFAKDEEPSPYLKKLRLISQSGRRFRERQNQIDSKSRLIVYRPRPPNGGPAYGKNFGKHTKFAVQTPLRKPFNKPMKKSSQKPFQKPANKPQATKQTPKKTTKQTPEMTPEQNPEQAPEQTTKQATEQATEKTIEQSTEQSTEQAHEQAAKPAATQEN